MLDIEFSIFPELHTERLFLRKLNMNDAEPIFEIRSNPEVMKYMGRPIAASLDDAVAHIEKVLQNMMNNTGIDWGIEEKKSGKLIGTIAFWKIIKEDSRAELGYILHHNWHHKGLMNEALQAILSFGFKTIGLHSVMANIDPLNLASMKLLEKNKFRKEAHFKENFFFEGRFLDSVIYSLVKLIDYK
ncbi:MAG TPA: GNAT family N-acetyltransferase [Bacteroidia bacterium]|jgi:ribosomal-protein-alanine N-acetyltransferase|nr:GNAT family N-acetyltransferase [Bacteroidia bacterium]